MNRKQTKQNILITRSLSDRQREYAITIGLNPIERPALEFELPSHWDYAFETIGNHPESAWAFTSQNGVKALRQMTKAGLKVHPETQIYAVGSQTQQTLQNLGVKARAPLQQNGAHLAELIAEDNEADSIIYFRGNLSRSEISSILIPKGIDVIGIEVYKTIIHPVKLPQEPVEAILFFSPSAVKGFKQGQGFDQALPLLFAIGPTTAGALKNETNQPVKYPETPETEALLQVVSDFLFQEKQ